MSAAWATVIAACIAAASAVLVAFINKFRAENRKDHGQVMTVLGAITRMMGDHSHKIDRIDSKLERHIDSHNH